MSEKTVEAIVLEIYGLREQVSNLKREVRHLKTILESAHKFKQWSLDVMAKNGICFVKENRTDDEFRLPKWKNA